MRYEMTREDQIAFVLITIGAFVFVALQMAITIYFCKRAERKEASDLESRGSSRSTQYRIRRDSESSEEFPFRPTSEDSQHRNGGIVARPLTPPSRRFLRGARRVLPWGSNMEDRY